MRALIPAIGAALVIAASLSGCSDSSSNATADATSGARDVSVTLTDAGCDPAELEVPSGAITFKVENDGADGVTELEVIKGDRILGEVENLAPAFSGDFTLTLQPGTYELYCPNGDSAERGTLTVTGNAVAHAEGASAAAASYRAYALAQARLLEKRTTSFTNAVRAGNVAAAERLFPTAREPYERIEPVAESFGDLDPESQASGAPLGDTREQDPVNPESSTSTRTSA